MIRTRRKAALEVGAGLLALGCDPRVTAIGELREDTRAGVYLEAESGELSGGFEIGDDPEASGAEYVGAHVGAISDDAPGPARARYVLHAPHDGVYQVWGRVHTQTIGENRFWFQVDGGAFTKWRITTGDTWFWDAFHDDVDYGNAIDFDLAAGDHDLVIASSVDEARLDRLYFVPEGGEPPPDDAPCNPPHTIPLGGECSPSCGTLRGTCGGDTCVDVPAVATFDCAACCVPPP